jgi:hypothetical protein
MAESADTTSQASSSPLHSRLLRLESALKLDDRLKSLEEGIAAKGLIDSKPPPWWRNGKTVTVLGALIAAVLPAVTAINGAMQNYRDSQRLLLEQQDKIRQTYLDRALKSDLKPLEQELIFRLLAKLKSDRELQEWANEQLNRASSTVEELNHQKSEQESRNKELEAQIDKLSRDVASSGQDRARYAAELRKLQSALSQGQQRTTELRERVGENTSDDIGHPITINGGVSSWDGQGVPATVTVAGGPTIHTDARGIFHLVLPSTVKPGQTVRLLAVALRSSKESSTLEVVAPASGESTAFFVLSPTVSSMR